MAVFYDLEDGDHQHSASRWNQDFRSALPERHRLAITGKLKPVLDKSAIVPTCDNTTVVIDPEEEQDQINIMAAALTCYP